MQSVPEYSFKKDVLQDGIQLLEHILKEHRVAELDAVFEGPNIVGIRHFDHLQRVEGCREAKIDTSEALQIVIYQFEVGIYDKEY